MRGPTPARRTAHDVLMRVTATAAYGGRALDTALSRGNLAERDRALVTELVYGTLRHSGDLDDRLSQYLQQPLAKLPPPVRIALQLGAYQILHTRVPVHSAVDESVILVRRFGRLTGVVNAVLRRLAQDHAPTATPAVATEADLPRRNDRLEAGDVATLATQGSHPPWLVAQVVAHLGFEAAAAWVHANNETAPLAVRVQSRRSNRDAVAAALRARGLEVTPHPNLLQNFSVRRSGKVTNLPGFQNGDFTVQDPAATLVGLFADPQPGQLVLDTCAAPGGKAMHLAELMGESGTVVAMDVHPGKARLIASAAQRLHLANVVPAVGDATDVASLQEALKTATAGRRQQADIVVVDAPCSGMR
jgi:16S rRNA (cytosine967-C5)-methyltransferase